MGVVGAAWLAEGNIPAAIYAFATGIVGATIPEPEVAAYTYMYSVRQSIGDPGPWHRDYI